MIQKVYLIVNPNRDPNGEHHARMIELLAKHGMTCIEPVRDGSGNFVNADEAASCDAIFTVGGDGTLIQASRELGDINRPFFPVHTGTLGYLTEATIETADEALGRIASGDYLIQKRMRIAGTLPDGKVVTALNDLVIFQMDRSHIFPFNLYINGKLIHTYRADGIIISTSTGSTGYNLSAGGAILEPEAEMMIVTPICPHTIRTTSLVVSSEDELEIEVLHNPESTSSIAATFDGGEMIMLKPYERVTVRKACQMTSLIRFEDDSFLDALYKKMKEN